MHFLFVLAILAALVLAEACPTQPASAPAFRLGLAVLGIVLVWLFALVGSKWIARRLRHDPNGRILALARFRTLRRIHLLLWLATAGGILYGLAWPQLVRFNWGLERAVLLDELLLFTPVLLPWVLAWTAFYEVDRAARMAAITQGGRSGNSPVAIELPSRINYLVLHLRHYWGVLLVPIGVLLTIQDLAELFRPGILSTPYAWWIELPPLLVIFLFFPLFLRYIWRTSPLPAGPLRGRLVAAASRAGFRPREILLWHTDDMMLNAAVAGFVPWLRYVFLSDALLDRMEDREVEAVFRHELGHLRHRHVSLRLLALFAPVGLCLLLVQTLPNAFEQAEAWLQAGRLGSQIPAGLLLLGAMALYGLFLFGPFSRMLEMQADLYACRQPATDRQACPAPSCPAPDSPTRDFVSALEKLAALGGTDRRTSSWQHGSIAGRVAFLLQASHTPDRARRFHRRVWMVTGLFAMVALSPLAYCLLLNAR